MRAFKTTAKISMKEVMYGGLCEENVESVFGDTTKSKTDMWLCLSNGKRLNVSIKKDAGGQVFLIGIDRFVNGFELQYKRKIPQNVKRAISLYFGSAEDTVDIVKKYGFKKDYEKRKHRLVAETLNSYDSELSKCLIDWFNDNMYEVFDFCFSRIGKNQEDWVEIVWYKNTLGENDFDTMIYLSDMIKFPKTQNTEYATVAVRFSYHLALFSGTVQLKSFLEICNFITPIKKC